MPTYVYKCKKCEFETSKMVKVNERTAPQTCANCGEDAEYLPYTVAPSFQLKGSGWYKSGGY